jgi:CHAT domain-containing protein
MNGEFQTALQLIEEAHAGYAALQMELPALRTNVGKMHVLNELGRHQEALAAGEVALQRVQNAPPGDQIENNPESRLIVMLTHMNQGICYRRMGQYEQALIVYEAAEKECVEHNFTHHLGDIRNNVGVTLMYLGRVAEALAAFEAAAAACVTAGHTRLYALCLSNIGEAHLMLGNYRASLDALRSGRQQLERLQAAADEHLLLLEAHVYLALNLYPEALLVYKQASDYCQAAGMTHYHARALWGAGIAYIAQNQFDQAQTALQEASRLFAISENIPFRAAVLLEQAALQTARGNREIARKTAQEAANLLIGKDYPVEQIYAYLRLADLSENDLTVVEKNLVAAHQLIQNLPLPHLRYRIQQRLGQMHRQQGNLTEAEQHLKAAVADIEQLRGSVAQEAMRVSFLYDKTAAYEELLQLYLDSDRVEDAFAIAEQAKARALVDLLAGVDQPVAFLPNAQTTRLQQLQADLNAVYSGFLGGKSGREPTATPLELQARAQMLEQEINRVRLQTAVSGPGDPFAAPLPLTEIATALPSDTVLLVYHQLGDELLAFVHWDGETRAVRHLSRIEQTQRLLQRLHMQWDRFRAGDVFIQRHTHQLEQSAQRILAELYDALIAPLANLLPTSENERPRRLAIIPRGLLHQIPFHALYDGERYLLEYFEISYAPSATALALCQRRSAQPAPRAVIAGVADELIPAVDVELKAVAQEARPRWSEIIVYQNEAATKEAIRQSSDGVGLLHLACHGLFRADNPMFSALKLGDGWLTAVDALQLNLNGALVALSACESGRSQVVAQGDELLGLTRAFLGAGAASLLVSLWLAQDKATAQLMASWYAQLSQSDSIEPAAALRAAQLRLKTEHAHPYYWAPFILIGKN